MFFYFLYFTLLRPLAAFTNTDKLLWQKINIPHFGGILWFSPLQVHFIYFFCWLLQGKLLTWKCLFFTLIDLLLYYAGWLDVCISHDKLRNWHSGSCEILEERLAKLSLEGCQVKDQTLDPTQKLATFSFCCNCCKYTRSINMAVRLIRIHEHL